MVAPTLRDRLKPFELLGLSAILGGFIGVVIMFSTREWLLAVVGFGIAFIVSIMVIAMLELALKPDAAEKLDLEEQDRSGH